MLLSYVYKEKDLFAKEFPDSLFIKPPSLFTKFWEKFQPYPQILRPSWIKHPRERE